MPRTHGKRAFLVDTNVLLRIALFATYHDRALLSGVARLRRDGAALCVAVQNVAEFWNVVTRPQEHRGFGRTIQEVAIETDIIRDEFTLLPETVGSFQRWRTLVEDYNVTGVLVHDARLAAIMLEYGISDILTLNARDFARFPFITAIDPRETA